MQFPNAPLKSRRAAAEHRLVAFDVDGTLIQNAQQKVIWQLLNERYGRSPEENGARFAAFLAGEFSYERWVELDVGGWQQAGATRNELAEVILAHLTLTPGARRAVAALKQRGYRLAVISGTLDLTLELLFPEHPFEAVYTNRIWFDGQGRIAGWQATPYDMEGKAEALLQLTAELAVPLERTVFVGDNINDLKVMATAGTAIAFEPKHPDVAAAADHVLQRSLVTLPELL